MENPEKFIFSDIEWEQKGHLLSMVLNRPEKRNAISAAMAREIVYLLTFAKSAEDVRVVQIAAKGKVFSAGGDLAAMRGESVESSSTVPSLAKDPNAPNADLNMIANAMRNLCKPSILIVEGSVFAGALLLVCNATHVYALDSIEFSAPEIHRGLWPYMVMAGLFRIVPKRKALDWILMGHAITSEHAEDWGLINKALPESKLKIEVDKKIEEIIKLPPKTVSLGLQALNAQEDMEYSESMSYLAKMLVETLEKGDAEEGISAFFEKRKPDWIS